MTSANTTIEQKTTTQEQAGTLHIYSITPVLNENGSAVRLCVGDMFPSSKCSIICFHGCLYLAHRVSRWSVVISTHGFPAPLIFANTNHKLHQHRLTPNSNTKVSRKMICHSANFSPLHFFSEEKKNSGETNPGSVAGTRRNQEIKMEQKPCPEGKKKRETSPGTLLGTKRNQEIMMEKHFFPEKRKKSKMRRQAPELEPEPEGTRKS